MKNLSISRSSWLFKVAVYGGYDDYGDRTDFCRLFWTCMWGLIRAPFFVSLFGGLGAAVLYFMIMNPIISIIVWFQTGLIIDVGLFEIQMGIWLGFLFVAYSAWADYRDRDNVVVNGWKFTSEKVGDGFDSIVSLVRAGYRGWKDKTCVFIDVVDGRK